MFIFYRIFVQCRANQTLVDLWNNHDGTNRLRRWFDEEDKKIDIIGLFVCSAFILRCAYLVHHGASLSRGLLLVGCFAIVFGTMFLASFLPVAFSIPTVRRFIRDYSGLRDMNLFSRSFTIESMDERELKTWAAEYLTDFYCRIHNHIRALGKRISLDEVNAMMWEFNRVHAIMYRFGLVEKNRERYLLSDTERFKAELAQREALRKVSTESTAVSGQA
jgi:hypothetical protein